MADFFAMGGYAEFVWGSFGLAVATLVFNLVSARRRLQTTLGRLTERAARRNQRLNRQGSFDT